MSADPPITNRLASGLQGSRILAIAGHVARLEAQGHEIANLTIGDFDPHEFPIPDALLEGIELHLRAGETNYPPAVGTPQLRAAVRAFYERELGLVCPQGSVQVGSGARPPIFAAFQVILDPGDVVVYPVPTWNVRHYVYLNQGVGVPVITRPENGFMPTADDLLPHLPTARMLVLNSPLNPTGTVIDEGLLTEICQAIVAENRDRKLRGERPLVLLYDQVYWQLVFEGHAHHTPTSVVPEMADYTIYIDAISKSWAATGLRVGWAVAPVPVVDKMKPLIGHMGAWAPRAEQLATAALLAEPERVQPFMAHFVGTVQGRLQRVAAGLRALRDEGLPVDCLEPQGAIYLSVRFDLPGFADDEALRTVLLEQAGVAVVPFTAFGYPDGTGWVRMSVGAVSEAAIDGALERLGNLLRSSK